MIKVKNDFAWNRQYCYYGGFTGLPRHEIRGKTRSLKAEFSGKYFLCKV